MNLTENARINKKSRSALLTEIASIKTNSPVDCLVMNYITCIMDDEISI
jgi:hypothetical protein